MGVIEVVKKQERQLGLQKGLKEGLQKGRLEERAKAEAEKLAHAKGQAKKMLKAGLSIDAIVEFTDLSIEEVEKLK